MNNNQKNSELSFQIEALIKSLFPICRSITGNGVRETLHQVSNIIPLKINEIPTGTKVLDWEIPKEWNIKDAWIKDSKNKKIVDFKDCNLHILNYSEPIHKRVTLEELKKHLFTLPDLPDLIPYRTSYHHRSWGFCLAHNEYETLKKGEYEVFVDSTLSDGSLTYGELLIKGEIDEEILISTHICHPSLANDNLSGIAITTFLAKNIIDSDKKPRYSYRFLFIPGTIGSISWLSKNEKNIDKIKFGLVLTLLGDAEDFHFKKSRTGNKPIDKIVESYFINAHISYKISDFSPYGYDERQFCSPGFDMPVGRLSRSTHGQFPEYHTSADNLSFIKKEYLLESFNVISGIFGYIENNKKYLNLNPKGEPQLGKRGLFKKIGGQSDTKDYQMALLWILNQSDGQHSLLDITMKSNISFDTILDAAKTLEEKGLLKEIKNEY